MEAGLQSSGLLKFMRLKVCARAAAPVGCTDVVVACGGGICSLQLVALLDALGPTDLANRHWVWD